MNPQLERLFHSVRRGIETNVQIAMKTLELSRNKEIKMLVKRVDEIRNGEFRVVRKKLDEIKDRLNEIETLRPYVAAVEQMVQGGKQRKRPTKRKRAAKKSNGHAKSARARKIA